jgi:hypothetical protein
VDDEQGSEVPPLAPGETPPADPRFVTEAEWRTAHDAGVRTVIDLRCGESRGRRSSSSFTP